MLGVQSLSHWTTREVTAFFFFFKTLINPHKHSAEVVTLNKGEFETEKLFNLPMDSQLASDRASSSVCS